MNMNRLTLVIITTLAALTVFGGCTAQQKSAMTGDLTKRDIYLRLMTPEQAAQFRLMEKEDRDEVQIILYCQEIGVYQKWRAVPPERQALIRKGRLVEGLSLDEVRMAWGRPAAVEDATSAAQRQEGRQSQLWKFDPTADRQGNPVYAREACFLDQKLLWFKDFRDRATAKPVVWKWDWFGLVK
jgi:hypothetical protein